MTRENGHFFGTDGIRGRVGDKLMAADFVLKLGWAIGSELRKQNGSKVVIGKDTRSSGYMIESALEAGLSAAGIDSLMLGPMPTPAVAYLTRALRADLGIVISASHNSFEDNGIKIFTADGFKISKEFEEQVEATAQKPMTTVSASHIGKAKRIDDGQGRYIEFCKSSIPHRTNFKNLKIVIDCAHGATYHIAPFVFSELGADVVAINTAPNGLNINLNCGSNYPEIVREHLLLEKADVGIALDGDGDRIIMIDHQNEILNGDELLYIIAKGLIGRHYFSGGVIGTVMSNQGLENAIANLGLAFIRVPVGDYHIISELQRRNWKLGGEPSGHVIYLNANTTADGIITGLQVLQAMKEKGMSLHDIKKGIDIFPHVIKNIPVKDYSLDLQNGSIGKVIADVKDQLGHEGRVLVRYSGTEPLIRVMVEGRDKNLINEMSEKICSCLKECS